MNYYSGGLAEIVSQPSRITMGYLSQWFCATGSLGKAMTILGLPYNQISESILKMAEDQLVVDLDVEQEVFYRRTIFEYLPQSEINQTPKLGISWLKVFNFSNLINTLKILMWQSRLIALQSGIVGKVKKIVDSIPTEIEADVSRQLLNEIWPKIIAVDFIVEFYSQYTHSQNKSILSDLDSQVAALVSKHDWFFRSVYDKCGNFTQYLKEFGLRADDDYELTCPRWWEIPNIIKKRYATIQKVTFDDGKDNLPVEFSNLAQLQILRLEAKKKALPFINQLRQDLNLKGSMSKTSSKSHKKTAVLSGKGMPVSSGTANGKVFVFTDSSQAVPENTIGVFPNASIQFTFQFPKCVGLIFLKGGQTSHGAIVAREFKIPALIDPKAKNLSAGASLSLNGGEGTWQIN